MKIQNQIFLVVLSVFLTSTIQCNNPLQPQLPKSLLGKWKLVRNDAMNGCDTLEYCYMKAISRDLVYKGDTDIQIGYRLYGFKFKEDTLVIIDDIKRTPGVSSTCCEDIVYYWHYTPYSGNIPPDDSPCARCL